MNNEEKVIAATALKADDLAKHCKLEDPCDTLSTFPSTPIPELWKEYRTTTSPIIKRAMEWALDRRLGESND